MLGIMGIILTRLLGVCGSCQGGRLHTAQKEGQHGPQEPGQPCPDAPLCWVGAHILGLAQWYSLGAGRRDNVH